MILSLSFLGENGKKIKNNAYTLLEKGLIHVIANDTHRITKHRYPNLNDTYELLILIYALKSIHKVDQNNLH